MDFFDLNQIFWLIQINACGFEWYHRKITNKFSLNWFIQIPSQEITKAMFNKFINYSFYIDRCKFNNPYILTISLTSCFTRLNLLFKIQPNAVLFPSRHVVGPTMIILNFGIRTRKYKTIACMWSCGELDVNLTSNLWQAGSGPCVAQDQQGLRPVFQWLSRCLCNS